jgi:hypothetical protein
LLLDQYLWFCLTAGKKALSFMCATSTTDLQLSYLHIMLSYLITSIPELFLQPACCAWFVLSTCCLTCCLSASYVWTNYWIDAVVYEPVCSVWTKYVLMQLCLCEIIEMHQVVIHELFGNIWK